MGRGSAGARLWGIGRGSAGARYRGMGRGNDAKTALSHKKIQVKIIENHGQGQYNRGKIKSGLFYGFLVIFLLINHRN